MFKTIKANNLFSWQDLNYEVKSGISQITGFNYDDNTSEGSGKSSVPNVLCWVLYGAIPKDARIDDVVREGCKGGSGQVVLDSGFSVFRSRKPNDLYITKPSGELLKGKDAKETQTLINNLIGLDFDAFCQTIYFAQNYPKKFVSATDVEKVSILSQVLDLTVFDKARKKAHDMLKQEEAKGMKLEQELALVNANLQRLQSNADLLVQFIERFEQEKAKSQAGLEEALKAAKEKLRTVEVSIKKLSKNVSLTADLEAVEKSLEAATEKKVQLYTAQRTRASSIEAKTQMELRAAKLALNLNKLKTKLEAFNSAEKNCPTCGGKVAEHMISHVFSEGEDLQRDFAQETQELADLKAKLASMVEPSSVEDLTKALRAAEKESLDLQATKRKLQTEQQSERLMAQELNSSLDQTKKAISSYTDAIAANEASQCTAELSKLETIDAEMGKFNEIRDQLEGDIKVSKNKFNNLDILKTGFKEVKQFVFQALLHELSVKSTKLASELFEVPVSIKFSNEDDEGGVTKILTTASLDGCVRPLGLYSGGQFKRIELAVDLALASIVGNRSQNPIKFRVLDEPFKDLTEGSMEKVVKLLEKLEGPTVIIEHNSITKSIIHNVFDIEYRGGISHAV